MARQSSNPAFTRMPAFNGSQGYQQQPQQQPYGQPYGQAGPDPLEQAYAAPPAGGLHTGRMTLEDVTVRTAILLATAIVTGGATWVLGLGALALPAAIIAFVMVLVISFKQITNPAVIVGFAAVEGVFLGGVSQMFENRYPGVVIQAVVGTVGVAAVMLGLYRSGKIRVTPKFTKMLLGAVGGFFILVMANFVASFFTPGGFGLREGGLGLIVGVVGIGLASMMLVLDFEFAVQGERQGLPERFAWLAAFGLMVTLVWLYVEILRVLALLQGRD